MAVDFGLRFVTGMTAIGLVHFSRRPSDADEDAKTHAYHDHRHRDSHLRHTQAVTARTLCRPAEHMQTSLRTMEYADGDA